MTRVRALGGTLEIRTEVGKGTTFLIRVPLTLAIVRALLADAGGERYAVPLAYVAETVEFDPRAVTALRSREALVVREQVIPTVHLRDLVAGRPAGAPARRPTVILEVGERRTALVVDALLGQQDIVVEPFDAPRGHAAVRRRGDDSRRRRTGAHSRRRRAAVGGEHGRRAGPEGAAARRAARGGQHRRRPRGDRAVADDQPHDHDRRAARSTSGRWRRSPTWSGGPTRSSPRC